MVNFLWHKKNLLFGFCFLLLSCDPPGREQLKVSQLSKGKVLVLNEGGFTYNNASIDVFDPSTDSLFSNQFELKNNSKLGDVAQSMAFINGQFWFVVNNSGKIVICDTNLVLQQEIRGFTSPRYLCKVSDDIVYLSDLYADKITLLSLSSKLVVGTIPFKGWSEEMIAYNDTLCLVTNVYRDHLYYIHTKLHRVVDSLKLSEGVSSLALDKNGKVWVACLGEESKKSKFKIVEVSPLEKKVLKSISSDKSLTVSPRLTFNASQDTLYWIESGLYQLPISSSTYPSERFYQQSGANFYGLGYDKSRKEIYLLDAKDYVQRGELIRLNNKGSKISKHSTGIIPNSILVF